MRSSPRYRRLSWLALFVGLSVAFPAAIYSQTQEPAAAARPADSGRDIAPVVLDGEVLFQLRGVSAFSAKDRAARVGERIKALADNPGFAPSRLRIQQAEDLHVIQFDDQVVLGVTDPDAQMEGISRALLARLCVEKISFAVTRYRKDRSSEALWAGVVRSVVATLLCALGLLILRFLYRRLERFAEGHYQRKVSEAKLQALKLVETQRIWSSIRAILQFARNFSILAVLLFWFNYLLGQFPWTRPISNQALNLVLDPLKVMGAATMAALPGLVFIAVLFTLVYYLLRFLKLMFQSVERGSLNLSGFEQEWALPTYRIVRLMVLAFALVVAYPYLPGSDSAAFKGVSLFLGVILSLGSSSAISNIIAGYSLTYRRAFRVGDRVGIGETIGDVVEVRLQVTHLRTVKNEEVIIPNSVILNSPVTNYSTLSAQRGLILHTIVGIGYETPWRQVEAMLLEAARRTPGLHTDPAPFVLAKSLGDFAVNYELNAFAQDPHLQERTYARMHANILDVFNEYGVQIMTPSYESDPDQPKVVPADQWFSAPAKPPENQSAATAP